MKRLDARELSLSHQSLLDARELPGFRGMLRHVQTVLSAWRTFAISWIDSIVTIRIMENTRCSTCTRLVVFLTGDAVPETLEGAPLDVGDSFE